MKKLGYMDEITKPYMSGLYKCKSHGQLKSHLMDWKEFVQDALEVVDSKDFDWEDFDKGLISEKMGKYSGDAWARQYGAILLPKIILEIGLIAEQFKVPDGVAFIRLKDVGVLIENKNGFLEMPSPKPKGKSK